MKGICETNPLPVVSDLQAIPSSAKRASDSNPRGPQLYSNYPPTEVRHEMKLPPKYMEPVPIV